MLAAPVGVRSVKWRIVEALSETRGVELWVLEWLQSWRESRRLAILVTGAVAPVSMADMWQV